MNPKSYERIQQILKVLSQKRFEHDEVCEKKINDWYTNKFLRRSRDGHMSNAEIDLLDKHRERRKTLYRKHTSDYYELLNFSDTLTTESQIQSKIVEIQQRHTEEKRKLYDILNSECYNQRIWKFPYEVLDKDPEIEKRTNRYFQYGLYFIIIGLGYNFTSLPTFKLWGFQFHNLMVAIGVLIVVSSMMASWGDDD